MNINTFNDVLGAKEIGIREILLDREGLSTYEDKIETLKEIRKVLKAR